jgi:hypothetical protein
VPEVETPQVALLVGLIVALGVRAADANLRAIGGDGVTAAAAAAVAAEEEEEEEEETEKREANKARTMKCTGCCWMCLARSMVMPVTCGKA